LCPADARWCCRVRPSERGDDELASQIDAVREQLAGGRWQVAGGILTAIYLLKQGMRQRGYNDEIIDAPQWRPRGTSEQSRRPGWDESPLFGMKSGRRSHCPQFGP
jgi:hypothetical protein